MEEIFARIERLRKGRAFSDESWQLIGMREMLAHIQEMVNKSMRKSQERGETGIWINGTVLDEKLDALGESLK